MIRHARMHGRPTLWLPGLDHASIAAQFVLDRILAAEGESRASWVASATSSGCGSSSSGRAASCSASSVASARPLDWGRLRFTMDEVQREGRPARVHAACTATASPTGPRRSSTGARAAGPASPTSRSIPTPETGTLWSIRYHLLDEAPGSPTPSARSPSPRRDPETILGDTAVAVHPRRPALRGARRPARPHPVRGPACPDHRRRVGRARLRHRRGEDHARRTTRRRPRDRAGAMACRHRRHDRRGARSTTAGRPTPASTGTRPGAGSSRTWPHAATSWRAAARDGHRPLPALETTSSSRASRPSGSSGPSRSPSRRSTATRSGRTTILPARFEKVWEHWLTNIRDWNVSRQLWWGHRIPAWYCPDGHITVSRAGRRPGRLRDLRAPAGGAAPGPGHLRHLVQLGPVAVLDPGLAGRHRRTCAGSTPARSWRPGYDIIFFWVARMMMLGIAPHRASRRSRPSTCTASSATRYGKKMSKTTGNVVDPLEAIDESAPTPCASP